jgi:hypothetical protein
MRLTPEEFYGDLERKTVDNSKNREGGSLFGRKVRIKKPPKRMKIVD